MANDPNAIPRGIEVLVKKASVDPAFKALLMARRADAAAEIGLELDAAEAMMLNAVAPGQLEAIIARTTVSAMSRAAFLGKAAAVMLAALGADLVAAEGPPPPGGIAPDRPPITAGRRERFVVYSETNYKGDVTYGILEQDAYDKRLAEVNATNRAVRQAYVVAAKAWADDEAHKGIPFPLRNVQLLQCSREATYSDRERAEELLKRRQEALNRRLEAAKEAEERRFAALSDEARAREKEKADLLKAAEALFEKELKKLSAGDPPPPVTRGISPDRPPMAPAAATGIRP